jgi:NADH:ubiquinone oxidoreductase subunit 5 (subunit L)/multisubunit Na+/H+ antiporter MnhA subunit
LSGSESCSFINLFTPLVVVVMSVIIFAVYYLSDGRGFVFFMAGYCTFITCMYTMVELTSWYFLIVRWEGMGVCSYYLISTFSGRSLANASSAGALTYN